MKITHIECSNVANIDFSHFREDVQLQAVLSVTSQDSADMSKSAQKSQSISAERSCSLVWELSI